jgi:hypothetical protein
MSPLGLPTGNIKMSYLSRQICEILEERVKLIAKWQNYKQTSLLDMYYAYWRGVNGIVEPAKWTMDYDEGLNFYKTMLVFFPPPAFESGNELPFFKKIAELVDSNSATASRISSIVGFAADAAVEAIYGKDQVAAAKAVYGKYKIEIDDLFERLAKDHEMFELVSALMRTKNEKEFEGLKLFVYV